MKSSVRSRIKITKNGKILRRKAGSGHNKTRKSNKTVVGMRKKKEMLVSETKLKNY